jgi:hypothetical protein
MGKWAVAEWTGRSFMSFPRCSVRTSCCSSGLLFRSFRYCSKGISPGATTVVGIGSAVAGSLLTLLAIFLGSRYRAQQERKLRFSILNKSTSSDGSSDRDGDPVQDEDLTSRPLGTPTDVADVRRNMLGLRYGSRRAADYNIDLVSQSENPVLSPASLNIKVPTSYLSKERITYYGNTPGAVTPARTARPAHIYVVHQDAAQPTTAYTVRNAEFEELPPGYVERTPQASAAIPSKNDASTSTTSLSPRGGFG